MENTLESTNKIKHLEFIQLVITRMNVNSFLIKGWSVTLIAGISALSTSTHNIKFIIIPFLMNLLFWGLDSYYLYLERKYRELYNEVVNKHETNFNMNVSQIRNQKFLSAMFSITNILFYGLVYMILFLFYTWIL